MNDYPHTLWYEYERLRHIFLPAYAQTVAIVNESPMRRVREEIAGGAPCGPRAAVPRNKIKMV